MAELKNQPPSTPVAAATRPPPDSTDAQKDAALETIRKARSIYPGAKAYDPGASEQTVSLSVNNGAHGGYYAIGRYFPNGFQAGVRVTDDELDELKREPQDIIHVTTPEELASLQGKGASGSSAPALSADEQKVLADFRNSGQDAATYLAAPPSNGTDSSASVSASDSSSRASSKR